MNNMTDAEKIELLRRGIMCAIIERFHTHPEEVNDMFTEEEFEEFAEQTKDFEDDILAGVYKDCLCLTETKDETS